VGSIVGLRKLQLCLPKQSYFLDGDHLGDDLHPLACGEGFLTLRGMFDGVR
jgi:hypothetical protein